MPNYNQSIITILGCTPIAQKLKFDAMPTFIEMLDLLKDHAHSDMATKYALNHFRRME